MPLPPQKFREIVFQLLYSYDMGRASEEETIPLLMAELAVTKKAVRDAQARVHQLLTKQQEIDGKIAAASLSYAFERIPSVERNILRLGVFELLFDSSIPPKVAIAEAIRLARKFSTAESATFINAVLDNVYKAQTGNAIDRAQFDETVNQLEESEERAHEASLSQPTCDENDALSEQ